MFLVVAALNLDRLIADLRFGLSGWVTHPILHYTSIALGVTLAPWLWWWLRPVKTTQEM